MLGYPGSRMAAAIYSKVLLRMLLFYIIIYTAIKPTHIALRLILFSFETSTASRIRVCAS